MELKVDINTVNKTIVVKSGNVKEIIKILLNHLDYQVITEAEKCLDEPEEVDDEPIFPSKIPTTSNPFYDWLVDFGALGVAKIT